MIVLGMVKEASDGFCRRVAGYQVYGCGLERYYFAGGGGSLLLKCQTTINVILIFGGWLVRLLELGWQIKEVYLEMYKKKQTVN